MIDITKYLNSKPPPLRPFDVGCDLTRVEDHLTALRPLQFVENKSVSEFFTIDYDLTGLRDILRREQPEKVYLNLYLDTPGGRIPISNTHILGVDADGSLWFASYGACISDRNEIAFKAEARRVYDEIARTDPDMLRSMGQEMQSPDEDWWKRGDDLPPT